MLQPVCAGFQNVMCRRVLKQASVVLAREFAGYKSTSCLGCHKQILRDLQKNDVTFSLINKLGVISTSSQEHGPFSITRISSRSFSGDPPTGDGGGTPGGMHAAPKKDCNSSGTASSSGDSGTDKEITDAGKTPKITKVTKKKAFDYSNFTTNIHILPLQAKLEYLLDEDDIEKLPKYTRRSAYGDGGKIQVLKRSEVEKLAIEKFGSLEKIRAEKRRRAIHRYNQGHYDSAPLEHTFKTLGTENQSIFNLPTEPKKKFTILQFLKSGSAKVVMVAIIINAMNCVVKFYAWHLTGSDSMFSECLHSVADTFNQIILAFGLYKSMKQPDSSHPYGYTNIRYISSLMSGLMIFFLGAGFSWSHAVQGFLHPDLMTFNSWAVGTLIFSFVSELISLVIAVIQSKKSAVAKNMTFKEYVKRGEDPNVNVVLLEDLAAVSGVAIAAACMGATHVFQNSYFDSSGSVLIGGVLAYVAWFIIKTNTSALIGRSIPIEKQAQITEELEQDRVIRSVHDVKATEMGGEIRYKAEVDYDGEEITRVYLHTVDVDLLMEEMQSVKTTDDVVKIMLNHGEKIVGRPGEEIDRIEKNLKSKHPDLRHVDLEAL